MPPIARARAAEYRLEFRQLVRLGAPVAGVQLCMMMLGIVDTMLMGRVSTAGLAGAALGNGFSLGALVLAGGTLHVLDPLVSQAVGAGDRAGMTLALQRGTVLALFLSVPIGILFWFAEPLLYWVSDQPEVAPIAAGYLRAIIPGVPGFLFFIVLRQTLQARSLVRPVLVAVLFGNVANLVLDWALIFGHLGLPALGATGSAIATSASRLLMAAALWFAARPLLADVWRWPDRRALTLAPYLSLLGKGLQIGIQMALEYWVFMVVAFLMLRIGKVEAAGHAVAMSLASLSFMVPLGIGAAAATRVGNAIGRGDAAGARRAAFAALLLGAAVMLVSCSAFLAVPAALARLFTDQPDVVAMAALLLPIAGVFQVFDGIQAVGCGILRGAADTKVAMLINLIGYWLIGLPVGIILADTFGLGAEGLWWAFTIGLATCAVLLVLRVRARIGVGPLVRYTGAS